MSLEKLEMCPQIRKFRNLDLDNNVHFVLSNAKFYFAFFSEYKTINRKRVEKFLVDFKNSININ
jgi:hypothetical protein